MGYNSTKSYVIANLLRKGYTVANSEFLCKRMINAGLSTVAVHALVNVFLDIKLDLGAIADIDSRIRITKYIDSLCIDDFAKSSFIERAAQYVSDESHEQWKRELDLFVRICNEKDE